MITTHGGGTSRKRMHAAKDYSGAEIMRTLRDEVLNRKIPVVDFTSAIELIMDDKGHCAGAVLMNMETGEILIAKAKVVIMLPAVQAECTTRLPDFQPLRCNRRRSGSGLSCWRSAA